jgi:ABC-type antimicrobial peptide transport system permease subunit
MMADAFGWEQPIGKQIWMNDTIPYTIIGMVEDFFTNGMWAKIEPTLLKLAGEEIYYSMAIRAESADLPGVLESLRETWTKLFPNYPFTGRYQEDTLEEEKSINRSIKQIYIFLAVVATLLSMTGLYTLISLSILNRTKEIGIRKVMGAEIRHIFVVLSRGFLINLAISSILGCVGGYFLSISLMESIWDHFTSMTAWVFIFTILIIFGVTLITTAGRIYAAATQNPADCLRYE